MPFLYYLPAVQKASLKEARQFGIGYAFEAEPACRGVLANGPDGNAGCLLAAADTVLSRLAVNCPAQQWRKIPGSIAWCGLWSEDKPPAATLARREQLAGHLIALADGESGKWLVPIARGWSEENGSPVWYVALPQRSRLGDDGLWTTGDIDQKYAALWEIATAWWDRKGTASVEESRVQFDFSGAHEAAVAALQANYRVGPVELSMLGAFDDRAVVRVLDALIDMPTLDGWLKKTSDRLEVATSSTPAGGPDFPTATDPP